VERGRERERKMPASRLHKPARSVFPHGSQSVRPTRDGRLVNFCFTPTDTKNNYTLGAAGHIILTPANALIVGYGANYMVSVPI
jgi:hypothetical protein